MCLVIPCFPSVAYVRLSDALLLRRDMFVPNWVGGHEALVPLLCAAGADPNAAAEKGSVLPLWWATRFGYYGVMSALLEAGADVDGVSSGRGRPLALAAGLGDADALRLLLAADADADADMGAALRRAAGGKVRRVWFQPPKSGVTKFDLGESSV